MEDTILLVDDEDDIREVLSLSLMDRGYAVLAAENGRQALELFHARHPAIVITDIKMPGMDGIELLERIKREHAETDVIMITGHGDMDLAIKSFRQDAIEFITKPVSVQALEAALAKVKEKREIKRQLEAYTENLELVLSEQGRRLESTQKEFLYQRDRAGLFGARDRFEALFDSLPCYIIIIDRKRRIVAQNRCAREDFRDQAGAYCYRALKGFASPCPECPAARSFQDGGTYRDETALEPPGKEKSQVFVWTAPVRDEAGAVQNVLIMGTHIAQVLTAQDHLSTLGLMISSVSHGIKGMLTGLDGGMYLLDMGIDQEDLAQVREGRDIVRQMVRRIRRMVLDILFYAKERELRLEPVDLAEFLQDIALTLDRKMKAGRIDFTCRAEPGSGTCEMDANALHIALVNLLENAVDACLEDETETNRQISLFIRPDGPDLVFEVRDNGIGMDAAAREKIFSLFYSAKGKKGTGLGLFVTRHIVEQHGGTIAVDSKKGEFTVFTIRMPRSRSASSLPER